jgi:predicted  nucleic acid-binding Zn-ribbon protein
VAEIAAITSRLTLAEQELETAKQSITALQDELKQTEEEVETVDILAEGNENEISLLKTKVLVANWRGGTPFSLM